MRLVPIARVPAEEQRSPTGRFHSFSRNLSLALGGIRNVGIAGGGHPFDVQVRRVPPGAAICPFHHHLAQWELFVVQAGRGLVRAGQRSYPVRRGDVFVHPPGEAHQLANPGRRDLEVMIIADHPPLDACFYPDSGKWGLRPPGLFFQLTPCDYFAGEDEPPGRTGDTARRPPGLPLPRPRTPFSRRRANLADIPWTTWRSLGGRFRQAYKDLSGAVGDVRNGWPQRGHPFNLELVRVPAGAAACPFHAHAAQWELFFILAGRGLVRAGRSRRAVGPGDIFIHPPGEPHQLLNTGRTPLTYYLVADNPPVDIWRYPDSDKWGFRPPRKIFRATDVPYLDGEE